MEFQESKMTNSMQKLFEDTLKDTYNAEKQFLKGMKKLAEAATSSDLKQAFEKHIGETEGHVQRLEKAAEMLEIKPGGKVCKAAQGLIEEAEEHLEEVEAGPVLDAAIIACAQKNEHYEICAYGTLLAWAEQLGLRDVSDLLDQTLQEEKSADQTLTGIAESMVNEEATLGKEQRATLR
jgi:ferritin-like metal-binding protein YciE